MFPLPQPNFANFLIPSSSSSPPAAPGVPSNVRVPLHPQQGYNQNIPYDTSTLDTFQTHRVPELSCHAGGNDPQRTRIFRMQQERLRCYSRSAFQKPTDADTFIQDMFKKQDLVKPSDIPKDVSGDSKRTMQPRMIPVASHNSELKSYPEAFAGYGRRLPQWCYMKSKVPPLYTAVEKLASRNGQLDTNLLYPILLSSGLNRSILGHIWFLVNQSVPGMLLPHELYAALALIALAQKGNTFHGLEILDTFSTPPVPHLQQIPEVSKGNVPSMRPEDSFMPTPEFPVQTEIDSKPLGIQMTNVNKVESVDDEFADFLTGPTNESCVLPPSVMLADNKIVGNRLANYTKTTDAKLTKSEIPVPATDAVENIDSDEEFAEFQQAKEIKEDCLSKEIKEVGNISSVHQSSSSAVGVKESVDADVVDTNPVQDKYSVFRELDMEMHNKNKNSDDEEFGDFHTNTETIPEPQSETEKNIFIQNELNVTIQDFSGMKNPSEESTVAFEQAEEISFDPFQVDATSYACPVKLNFSQGDHDNEEFGEFMSPSDIQDELLLSSPKDFTFIENQSVSSLEFSPVENVTLDSEALNDSFSRGSLSSLDKISSENFDPTRQSDNSDGISLSKSEDKEVNSEQQPSLDRYRFIAEELYSTNVEDPEWNIREWKNCLESCQRLVNDAYEIFKGISSPAVCDEVINSEGGQNYVKNLTEIYKVVCRIQTAATSMALVNDVLKNIFEEINFSWRAIEQILSLSCEEDTNIAFKQDSKNCGICLTIVDPSPDALYKLTYGGRQYHTTCANFWVNCVNSLLPSLSIPQFM